MGYNYLVEIIERKKMSHLLNENDYDDDNLSRYEHGHYSKYGDKKKFQIFFH